MARARKGTRATARKTAGEPTHKPNPKDVRHVRRAVELSVEHPERFVELTPEQLRRWAETGEWPESSD